MLLGIDVNKIFLLLRMRFDEYFIFYKYYFMVLNILSYVYIAAIHITEFKRKQVTLYNNKASGINLPITISFRSRIDHPLKSIL